MVGGTIVDIHNSKNIELAVKDGHNYAGVTVATNEDSRQIKVGDSIWWQGNKAFWTTADKSRQDVQIPKIGNFYSLRGSVHFARVRLQAMANFYVMKWFYVERFNGR